MVRIQKQRHLLNKLPLPIRQKTSWRLIRSRKQRAVRATKRKKRKKKTRTIKQRRSKTKTKRRKTTKRKRKKVAVRPGNLSQKVDHKMKKKVRITKNHSVMCGCLTPSCQSGLKYTLSC